MKKNYIFLSFIIFLYLVFLSLDVIFSCTVRGGVDGLCLKSIDLNLDFCLGYISPYICVPHHSVSSYN